MGRIPTAVSPPQENCKTGEALRGNVSAQTVVQSVDLGQLLTVFGVAGVAFERAAQQLHVRGRKQAGSGVGVSVSVIVTLLGVMVSRP